MLYVTTPSSAHSGRLSSPGQRRAGGGRLSWISGVSRPFREDWQLDKGNSVFKIALETIIWLCCLCVIVGPYTTLMWSIPIAYGPLWCWNMTLSGRVTEPSLGPLNAVHNCRGHLLKREVWERPVATLDRGGGGGCKFDLSSSYQIGSKTAYDPN